MELKLRCSLYLAVSTGLLTLLVGILNNVTLPAILYRSLVSIVLFAIIGYTCGQFVDQYLRRMSQPECQKGSNVDFLSQDEPTAESPGGSFKPLNPDNFETITLTDK